jgi:dihydroorotase
MLLLSNCKVLVHDTLVECNIAVDEHGKIKKLSRSTISGSFDKTIDCTGLVALPGMVDPHVHFRDPGQTQKEDFYSGSASALAGGTTTILDMPNNAPPVSTIARLKEKVALAKKKAVCDYGLYFGATPQNQQVAAEAIKNPAVFALKVYLGSSTGDLLVEHLADFERHMHTMPASFPVCVHAEDEHEIRKLTDEYKKRDSRGKVEYHNIIRSPTTAAISAEAACDAASKARRGVHLCHASTKAELDIVSTFKNGGVPVTLEVCTHHLFLTEHDAKALGNFGKVNPPLRSRVDVAAVWDELSKVRSPIDCIASDHAPHTIKEKEQDYWQAPSGVPGVQLRVPLMLDAANRNLVSLSQVVRYCASNPARIFGLSTKGVLAEGFDADIILVDLKKERTVRVDNQFSKAGWTPFEGRRLHASIEQTILGGRVAFDGEGICIKGGQGRLALRSVT